MQVHQLPHHRVLEVKYLYETNNKPARIKITDRNRFYEQKTQSKTFSFDGENVLQQAYDILTKNGWSVVGRGSKFDCFYLFVDNWGENYLELKNLK